MLQDLTAHCPKDEPLVVLSLGSNKLLIEYILGISLIQHGFHNIFSRRFTSIMFLKQQLVSKQTMLLSQTFNFLLSECLVADKLKVNKQILIEKLKAAHSSVQFLSDVEIEEILVQNNII
jgi:hypothetical protein